MILEFEFKCALLKLRKKPRFELEWHEEEYWNLSSSLKQL